MARKKPVTEVTLYIDIDGELGQSGVEQLIAQIKSEIAESTFVTHVYEGDFELNSGEEEE